MAVPTAPSHFGNPVQYLGQSEPRNASAGTAEADALQADTITNYCVHIALVLLVYMIAGKLGQATTSIRSSNLGPVWPAYGVALAALLGYGYRVWPGVAAGAFLVAFLSPVPFLAAAGQATGATLAALTGTFLLRRIGAFDPLLPRLRDALLLIVYGAFGSAIVSASIGIAALYATHVQAYSGIGPAWFIYWLGDSTGVLLVTPLVFTLPSLLRALSRGRIVEWTLLLVFLTVACFIVFGDLPFVSVELHVLAFAVFPFVMWAAITFGVGGAGFCVLLIATIATVETALGSGPFAANSPFINAVLLDVLFGVLSVSGLTLAASTTEARNAQADREQFVSEQAATDGRLRLATIVESSDDAILSNKLDGTILSWNAGAQRIFGFTEAEVVGQRTTMLIPPDRWDEEKQLLQRVQTGERIEHYETTRATKAGTTIDVSLTASAIRDSAGQVQGIAMVIRDNTEKKRSEEELTSIGRRLIDAQEQERSRIARELHDDISQRLALLATSLTRPGDKQMMILQEQATEIMSAVQSLSHKLHSSRLDHLGLKAAIKNFCEEFSTQCQVDVEFNSFNLPGILPPDISLCLFRVVQEALHNAAKHSGIGHFEVQLWGTPDAVHLVVRDQGVGFDVKSARETQGIGLLSMEERLKLVNGSLSIDSQLKGGTTISARVPFRAETSLSQAAGR